MRIVAIETATAASSIALGDGNEVIASARRSDRRGPGSMDLIDVHDRAHLD